MAQFKEPLPLSVLNLGLKRLPWNLSFVHYRKCISNWKKHGQLENKQTARTIFTALTTLSEMERIWGSYLAPHGGQHMPITTYINENSKSNYGRLSHYQLQMTVAPEHQEEVVSQISEPLQRAYILLATLGHCYTPPLNRSLNLNVGE